VGARRPNNGSCSISIRNPDMERKIRTQAGGKCVAGFGSVSRGLVCKMRKALKL